MPTFQISKLKADDLDVKEKLSDAAYDHYNRYIGERDALLLEIQEELELKKTTPDKIDIRIPEDIPRTERLHILHSKEDEVQTLDDIICKLNIKSRTRLDELCNQLSKVQDRVYVSNAILRSLEDNDYGDIHYGERRCLIIKERNLNCDAHIKYAGK